MSGRNLSLDLFGDRIPAAVLPFAVDKEEEAQRKRRLLKTLQEAVDGELTQRQKACLQRYYFDGLSMEEIGREMGITAATVSRHLKKARQRLGRVVGYAYPGLR